MTPKGTIAWNKPDLIGQRFGRLVVVGSAPSKGVGRNVYARWLCRCDCGKEKIARAVSLKRGDTTSCGCRLKEGWFRLGFFPRNKTHGLAQHPLYNVWDRMVSRCHNQKDQNWKNYGGRGIAVCDRWRKVENFIEDVGERPPGMWLDRIDNDGNYEPGNWRWATAKQQQNNKYRRKGYCVEAVLGFGG